MEAGEVHATLVGLIQCKHCENDKSGRRTFFAPAYTAPKISGFLIFDGGRDKCGHLRKTNL